MTDTTREPRTAGLTSDEADEIERQARTQAAPPPAEAVEDALRDALYLDVEEAQGIIRKHGFVFARHLPDVDVDDLSPENEAARWEKLAFTLYGMLMPSGHRIERIRALLATLPAEEKP